MFFLLFTLIIDVFIMFYFITRKDNVRSVYFVLLALASIAYTAGCILLDMSSTNDGVLTALKFANLGIPLLAPCFLLVSLSVFAPKYAKPWMLPAVGAYGLLIFIVILFNEYHWLYYSTVEFVENEGRAYIERGVLFVVQQVLAVLFMIPAYIIMIGRFIKSSKKIRRQMILIIIGALVVFSSNIINFIGVLPEELDPTPFAMMVFLILLTIDIAKYKFLDIVPITFATALKTMENAMIILDKDWCFVSCNNSAKSMFPSLASCSETEPIKNVKEWPSELKAADKLSEIVFELDGKMTQSSKSTYRANTNKIIDDHDVHVGWSIVIHDITSITFLINQLENLATTDSLTGVSNRRSFHEKVTRELDRSVRLNIPSALIMYDIDHFKKVNDTYGHAAGDHVLCAIVGIIIQQLRLYDIIARYGGEEFVIFMPLSGEDTTESALHKIALRLCKTVEDADITYNGKRIPVTASFGAVHMSPCADFNKAMLAVDEAMYEAKNTGRNRVVIGKL